MYRVRWGRVLLVGLLLMSPWLLGGLLGWFQEWPAVHGLNGWIRDAFTHPRAFKGLLLWGALWVCLLLAVQAGREKS